MGKTRQQFKKAAKELKINTDSFATDNYSFTQDLPWDFIV